MTQQPDHNQGGQPQQGQPQQGQSPQQQDAGQAQQAAAQQQAAQGHYAQQAAQQPQAQPPHQPQQGGQQHAQHQQQYPQQGSAPSAASAQGTGYPGQPGYPQQGYAQQQAPQGPQEKNFFAALFDFSFQEPTAEKYAKFFFLIVVITIAFHWLITTIFAFVDGNQTGSYDPWPGLISLLFGPLVVLVAVILVRVFFENAIGNIRTAEKLEKKED